MGLFKSCAQLSEGSKNKVKQLLLRKESAVVANTQRKVNPIMWANILTQYPLWNLSSPCI